MLGGFNPFDLGDLAQGTKKAAPAKKPVPAEQAQPAKPAQKKLEEKPKEKEVKKEDTKKEAVEEAKKTVKTKTSKSKPVKPTNTSRKVSKPAKTSKEDAEKEYHRKMRLAFEAQFGHVEGLKEDDKEDEDSESESDDNNDDFDDNEDLVELSKTYVERPSDDEMDTESEKEEEEETKKEEGPVIVRFTGSDRSTRDFNEKAEKKRFMSKKTPLSEVQKEEKEKLLSETQRRVPKTKEEEEEEKEDLQNDVALQRLINESSILHSQAAQSSFSGADISFLDDGPIGKARLKTLTSRIESLGGKHIPLQKNMPMLTRKMVNSKFQNKVKAEQEHAQEAGIILAKTAPVDNRFAIRKKKVVKRDRGLKINSVGKSTAGGIKLSKHEIRKFGGKI
ncbi:hypothetical protein B0I72DRAFT_141467 [Yarrowia lipolytica]|jgi:hypothetical protein|uniref:YALI0F05170p n=2 Tax=Yarrowia lipolytica TaxID=4952 RepID=Q6C2U1_YARLI|nr:YALI0F05170p [Yarrowia lipolytica CLIB122]AOW06689.1 hypothetical protein YALI1_F07819g [Yarrowia lipolytica]KAB8284796.1 hypothetical protein BKA91DRAFT_134391 [Yarrowia lipolytica]KAE8174789.1 hypothetical protein BKA90DRAFT_133457 [Yarrowia lipolytica]KAJ8056095.1 hypothetical protein LXG23DRAFT_19011 [Yarrowia lipolytica]QNQ01344.1 Hypothetical protein YALI2_F00889g [Yarrowia lipolytica]|eukprot:XP_505021.1 YALI0F05170p [Yarrowia lipolytica CLIB122]